MEALLVLIVIVFSIVLIVLAVKYNGKKEELHRLTLQVQELKEDQELLEMVEQENHKLTVHMQDLAHKQYQAWVNSESQNIRTQQLDLARREAAAAFEEWKSSYELTIRSDAIQRSQLVILGKVTEHLVPYLPTFTFNPKDARFILRERKRHPFSAVDHWPLDIPNRIHFCHIKLDKMRKQT